MLYPDILNILGVEVLPEYFAELFDEFNNEYKKDAEFLSFDTITLLAEQGFINAECIPDVNRCLEQIKQDEELDFTIKFLYSVICEKRNAWENYLYINPAPVKLGDEKYVFSLVLLIKVLDFGIVNARKAGINEKYVAQLRGVFGYATFDRSEHRWEVRNIYHWHINSALGMMFLIGRIKYEPSVIDGNYLGLRRKSDGKLLFVYKNTADIDKHGQFCRNGAEIAIKTKFNEKESEITANPIHP